MVARRTERGPALAACAAGLALAALGGASLRPSGAAETGYVPDAPARATATAPDAAGGAPQQVARRPVAEPAPDLTPPVRLELPGLGLSARVVPVAVDPDGQLDVPADPDVLGWWRYGAHPGQGRGSVLIDGHVDTARQGPGVFARLRELEPGDPVLIHSATGDLRHYRVTGRRQFPKAALPADTVFSQDVAERLVLITCGGRFDRDQRRYADNVVVFAVPESHTIPAL